MDYSLPLIKIRGLLKQMEALLQKQKYQEARNLSFDVSRELLDLNWSISKLEGDRNERDG